LCNLSRELKVSTPINKPIGNINNCLKQIRRLTMADIKITELNPAGSEFFADDENFMTELTEEELVVWGGDGGNVSLLNTNVSLLNTAANTLGNTLGNSLNVSL